MATTKLIRSYSRKHISIKEIQSSIAIRAESTESTTVVESDSYAAEMVRSTDQQEPVFLTDRVRPDPSSSIRREGQ